MYSKLKKSYPGCIFFTILVLMVIMTVQACVRSGVSAGYQQLNENQRRSIGKAAFLFGDMGQISLKTLESNGLVYKASVLSLLLSKGHDRWDSLKLQTQKELFMPFGFQYPNKVTTWPELGNGLAWEKPAGIVSGEVRVIHPLKGRLTLEVSNFGCASCHASTGFDASGMPTNTLVLGLPNTSLNLKAFSEALFSGYKLIAQHNNTWALEKVQRLFPQITKRELKGIDFYLSALRKEVIKMEATMDSPVTYDLGGAGYTNGIGSIKKVLGLSEGYSFHAEEAGLVSIPDLSDRGMRSSLLSCGNYATKGAEFFRMRSRSEADSTYYAKLGNIASIFTIGTMGFDDDMAYDARPYVQEAMRFLAKYRTPRIPLKPNFIKAEKGGKLYGKHCAGCHGHYSGNQEALKLEEFPNKAIPFTKIKTDSLRAIRITEKDLEALEKVKLGKWVDGKANRAYVAPILNGLWATAPYLHNGSVPTIWHLMHPEQRPTYFQLGGHALDFERMGIKGVQIGEAYLYPKAYVPWSTPELYNTQDIGRSNSGHEFPFDRLSEEEKTALIEYLKLL